MIAIGIGIAIAIEKESTRCGYSILDAAKRYFVRLVNGLSV